MSIFEPSGPGTTDTDIAIRIMTVLSKLTWCYVSNHSKYIEERNHILLYIHMPIVSSIHN